MFISAVQNASAPLCFQKQFDFSWVRCSIFFILLAAIAVRIPLTFRECTGQMLTQRMQLIHFLWSVSLGFFFEIAWTGIFPRTTRNW